MSIRRLNNKNNKTDRMRSYAMIFSRSSFVRVLKDNDLGFIDNKIKLYDKPRIGKEFSTYSEYIQYVYNQLVKNYRCEYIYKNEIINELILRRYGTVNTVVINEFKVGKSVADMVFFNGTSKAFEIKTELDSERRLSGQLQDYTRIFKECYIVTHESLIDKYKNADANVGLIAIEQKGKNLNMREVRAAVVNTQIDPDVLMRSIRTQEYKNIVKSYFGYLPSVGNFQMYVACMEQMKKIPNERLHQLFIAELKKRTTNIQSLKMYRKELMQVCLSLKITPEQYTQLSDMLCQTVKI